MMEASTTKYFLAVATALVLAGCNGIEPDYDVVLDPSTKISGKVYFYDTEAPVPFAQVYTVGVKSELFGPNPAVFYDSVNCDSTGYFEIKIPHIDTVHYFRLHVRVFGQEGGFWSDGDIFCNNNCSFLEAGNDWDQEMYLYRE